MFPTPVPGHHYITPPPLSQDVLQVADQLPVECSGGEDAIRARLRSGSEVRTVFAAHRKRHPEGAPHSSHALMYHSYTRTTHVSQSLTTEAHLNAALGNDVPKDVEAAPTADVVAAAVQADREMKVCYLLLSSCCLPCSYCVLISTHYFPDSVVPGARRGVEGFAKVASACRVHGLPGIRRRPRGGK